MVFQATLQVKQKVFTKPLHFLLHAFFFLLLAACSGSEQVVDEEIDPRFSAEKKEMVKYQQEIASQHLKKATTFLFDCEAENGKEQGSILEEREFDPDGRLTKKTEYHYSGELKSRTSYVYGPAGDKTYQNLYNERGAVIQTKYFDAMGYDTLTRNFLETGQIRNEMRKLIKRNSDGLPVSIEERDNEDRKHSLTTYSYAGNKVLEETFVRFSAVSSDEVATQVIQYNEFGDRVYMSTSTASIIEDEVSMEYEYNKWNKIGRARLLDKNGMLIRQKVNTFYDDGTPSQVSDFHFDPETGETLRTYEENFNESEKLVSYYMKGAAGNITQSGEFTYDGKKLLESIEFNQEQAPNYVCTYLSYEYYN